MSNQTLIYEGLYNDVTGVIGASLSEPQLVAISGSPSPVWSMFASRLAYDRISKRKILMLRRPRATGSAPGAHRAAQPPAARCAPAAIIIYTSSFARSATSPSFAYVINPAGQLYVQSFNCYSPIASASIAAPQSHPLQLLLPDRVCFSCYSRICFDLPLHVRMTH